MSQARHVNCKWQSITTRPPADGLGQRKPEKEKKDKISLIRPAGLHKDDVLRYFKKYGKVKTSHDVGDKFVVQFSSTEHVDLAIELQEFSDHKIGKVTFQVERFEPTDEELNIWIEQCDASDSVKRKAPAANDPRETKFGRRTMVNGSAEPAAAPSVAVEKNANGHLVGCECARCYHMTRAATMFAEQQLVVAAALAAAEEAEGEADEDAPFDPFDGSEAQEPPAPPKPNVNGHLPGCICAKCRALEGGNDAPEPSPIGALGSIGMFAKAAAPAAQTVLKPMPTKPSGHLPGCICPKCTGVGGDFFKKPEAPDTSQPMLGGGKGKGAGRGQPGHLPGCICPKCRGVEEKEKPDPVQAGAMNPWGHIPLCICPKCRAWKAQNSMGMEWGGGGNEW